MPRLKKQKAPQLSSIARDNIDAIARVEQQLLSRRPLLLRIGDAIAHFFGSIWFIAVQVILIGTWMAWNLTPGKLEDLRTAAPVLKPLAALAERPHRLFDPYPYPLLSVVVDIEFLLLTTFVLMNQKHASRRNEHWAHLHLQLSMLTEQEVTKNLQLLNRLCEQLGCGLPRGDRQLDELSEPKSVDLIVSELEKSRSAASEVVPPIKAVESIEKRVAARSDKTADRPRDP